MSFKDLPLWLNLVVFVGGATLVWFTGSMLSRYVDALSDALRIGKAFAGLLLLGGITSLPEIAASSTAAAAGDAPLAVNNILGGTALQVALLALADMAVGRSALSSVVTEPVVMLQATFSILLFVMIAAGIIVGDVSVAGVGAWTASLFAAFLLFLWLNARYQGRHAWIPDQNGRVVHSRGGRRRGDSDHAVAQLVGRIAAAAVAILVAGYFLTLAAVAFAEQTGLGSNFFGAVFLALATSMPEVSTVIAAARLGAYGMALGDIFGTNLFDKALMFLIDAIYVGPPVLNEVGTKFPVVAALLGIALTTIYIAGVVERRDRTVLRMGYDSAAVLTLYAAGLVLLFFLR